MKKEKARFTILLILVVYTLFLAYTFSGDYRYQTRGGVNNHFLCGSWLLVGFFFSFENLIYTTRRATNDFAFRNFAPLPPFVVKLAKICLLCEGKGRHFCETTKSRTLAWHRSPAWTRISHLAGHSPQRWQATPRPHLVCLARWPHLHRNWVLLPKIRQPLQQPKRLPGLTRH